MVRKNLIHVVRDVVNANVMKAREARFYRLILPYSLESVRWVQIWEDTI
jgi:hypothetical protein